MHLQYKKIIIGKFSPIQFINNGLLSITHWNTISRQELSTKIEVIYLNKSNNLVLSGERYVVRVVYFE